jgi:hypothetical protein
MNWMWLFSTLLAHLFTVGAIKFVAFRSIFRVRISTESEQISTSSLSVLLCLSPAGLGIELTNSEEDRRRIKEHAVEQWKTSLSFPSHFPMNHLHSTGQTGRKTETVSGRYGLLRMHNGLRSTVSPSVDSFSTTSAHSNNPLSMRTHLAQACYSRISGDRELLIFTPN